MAESNQDASDRSSPKHDPHSEHSEHINIARNNVRRRLDFGPSEVDEERLQYLQGENQSKERQKALEKWNFDFENEVPLSGDWEWEKVATDEAVPNSAKVLTSLKNKLKDNRNV